MGREWKILYGKRAKVVIERRQDRRRKQDMGRGQDMRRQQDAGRKQLMGRVVTRKERRASRVGDGFDPDGFARCLHFLEVVRSETWRTGHESGRRWCGSV